MRNQYKERLIQEVSNTLYDFLLPDLTSKIYPPDEYDNEALIIVERLHSQTDLVKLRAASTIAETFTAQLEHQYTPESFMPISEVIIETLQKYRTINENM